MEGLFLQDVLQLCVALAARASLNPALHRKKTTGLSGQIPVILWKMEQHSHQHISGKKVGQHIQQ